MRLYRNSRGQVKVPTYGQWAAYELGMAITAMVVAVAIKTAQHKLRLNDWEMREIVRQWAEDESNG